MRGYLDVSIFLATAVVLGACSGRDVEPSGGGNAPVGHGSADPKHVLSSVASPEALYMEANRELTTMTSSAYTHETYVDETQRIFNFDCSGFLIYALTRSDPHAISDLETERHESRPLAEDFVGFFSALPQPGQTNGTFGEKRWDKVLRVVDLERGDVVAWLEPQASDSRNTGHTMIVRSKLANHPYIAGGILVPVIDSTETPHGADDTRAPSGQGLGAGTIVLLTDSGGAPIGFKWSDSPDSKAISTTVRLARLK
jgi:hypothetical protein